MGSDEQSPSNPKRRVLHQHPQILPPRSDLKFGQPLIEGMISIRFIESKISRTSPKVSHLSFHPVSLAALSTDTIALQYAYCIFQLKKYHVAYFPGASGSPPYFVARSFHTPRFNFSATSASMSKPGRTCTATPK